MKVNHYFIVTDFMVAVLQTKDKEVFRSISEESVSNRTYDEVLDIVILRKKSGHHSHIA